MKPPDDPTDALIAAVVVLGLVMGAAVSVITWTQYLFYLSGR